MNVLYLHTHDMGRYNRMYGYDLDTPCFAEIAKRGTLFTNAYCAGPTCSPSRAALLTSQAPHSAGIFGLANMGFEISSPQQHLSHYLHSHGFYTALCGVQHETVSPHSLGYDSVFVPSGSFEEQDLATVAEAAQLLESYCSDKPFFLSVGLLFPHRPFKEELGDINPDLLTLPHTIPDVSETRLDFARYAASLREADRNAAVVMQALEKSGHIDDTVVVLTTDHGIAFPNMKCTLYDSGIGVSLAICLPGASTNGSSCNALVSQIDIFPTLCDILGLPSPTWLQGKSLLPLLTGKAEQVNDYLYSEVNYHVSYEPMRCVRSDRYKYIKRFHSHPMPILPNIDMGPCKDYLLAHGIAKKAPLIEELYDLTNDPNEQHNLVGRPDYETVCKDLRLQLVDWMTKTNDPLLSGDIPLPGGAITVPPDRCHSSDR